mmetsp:Transcript_10085/g.26895  ORF Transcript_10085/g.26895 Transcript_10085/m.26895 type:complete len:338 (-) Transcript_10085:140-1153(-)
MCARLQTRVPNDPLRARWLHGTEVHSPHVALGAIAPFQMQGQVPAPSRLRSRHHAAPAASTSKSHMPAPCPTSPTSIVPATSMRHQRRRRVAPIASGHLGVTATPPPATSASGRGCVRLWPPSGLGRVGDGERGLDRLAIVEARVAVGLVVVGEHLLRDLDEAARALGDRLLAGHLDVHAAQHRAVRLVDRDRLGELRHDVAVVARLELVRRRGDRVAVDAVRLPHDVDPRLLHRLDVRRQHRLHLVLAVARDEHELALDVVGVEDLDQLLELVRLHRRAHLAPNRVLDAAKVLDMPAEELPRAVADPYHVRRQIVVTLAGDSARERLLEVELHRLM